MEFLSGGSTSNCRRKLRWTVMTDVVFAYSTAQNAFCCLVGAILNILCPRERRVFQSNLEVSSNNQCNLHHSPHTGHLEREKKKEKKKGYNLFRTRCILKSIYHIGHKTRRPWEILWTFYIGTKLLLCQRCLVRVLGWDHPNWFRSAGLAPSNRTRPSFHIPFNSSFTRSLWH